MTLKQYLTSLTLTTLTLTLDGQQVMSRRVADLNPGGVGSYPSNFITFNGGLCFSAYTFELGRELFSYDGATISLVTNINDQVHDEGGGVFAGNDSAPSGFTLFNGALYFSAYDQRRGGELWRYDGTRAVRVADINPDLNDMIKAFPKNSWPQELTVMGNALYFSADVPIGFVSVFPNYELWRYNGVSASMVANIHGDIGTNHGSYPSHLTVFNNTLYFAADDGVNGYELWKYDGAHAVLLANINPGVDSSFPKMFTAYKNTLYFQAFDNLNGFELWKTDGTTVSLVTNLNPTGDSLPEFFTIFKDTLYFAANDGVNGFELWKYDGASATLAADINAAGDSSAKNLTVFQDNLYFAANDGVHGWELWKYDGGSASLLADLNPDGDSFPEEFTIVNNRLWFTASNSIVGYELWLFDGHSVSLATDILPGPPSSYPLYLAGFGSELCFSANDSYFSDWELWTAAFRPLRIMNLEPLGTAVRVSWSTFGGTTNIVQFSDHVGGAFRDISQPMVIPGNSETSASFLDQFSKPLPARFYRIMQP